MTFSRGRWSFGAEHELADIPLDTPLPEGFGWDRRDVTIVNSNGIANDPRGKLYGFGGEINTPPTDSPAGQAEVLLRVRKLFPMAQVNHRSNLHIHVRVPGLREDLWALKRVQAFVHKAMPQLFGVVEPLPRPVMTGRGPVDVGAVRRWKRRRVSHQTLLTPKRLEHQLAARSIQEFFNREPPASREGTPLWACQPRLCVNLRQLLETDTVEFRHFPGTLDESEVYACARWCELFLQAALWGQFDLEALKRLAGAFAFPKFPVYLHWRESRYRATCHDGTIKKEDIAKNIAKILAGEFGPEHD